MRVTEEARTAALPARYEDRTHDGFLWLATGPGESLWFIRWAEASGAVAAFGSCSSSPRFRGTASDIGEARREAARIAALIAAGKTRED